MNADVLVMRPQVKPPNGLLRLEQHHSNCGHAGGSKQPLPQQYAFGGLKITPDRLGRGADVQGSRAERQDRCCETDPRGGAVIACKCLRSPGSSWRNVCDQLWGSAPPAIFGRRRHSTFKTVLVPAMEHASDAAVFSSALLAARPFAAHLEFLHVKVDVTDIIVSMAAGGVAGRGIQPLINCLEGVMPARAEGPHVRSHPRRF